MNGEIGVLYQGEQVGGVFNWEIEGIMGEGAKGRWKAPNATKKVTAFSYWLVKKPEGNIFNVELYQRIKNQLVLISTGRVKLKLPEVDILNTKLLAPLRLRWIDD